MTLFPLKILCWNVTILELSYDLNQVVPEVKITQSLRKDIWSSLLLGIMKLRLHIAHNSNVK